MTITIKSTNALHVPSLFAGLRILAKKDPKTAYWTLALTCKTMPSALVHDVISGKQSVTETDEGVTIEWEKPLGKLEDYFVQEIE